MRVKAIYLHESGYYWCTHDLAMTLADGERFPEKWNIVELNRTYLDFPGSDVSVRVEEVPSYVVFYGPIQPPTA